MFPPPSLADLRRRGVETESSRERIRPEPEPEPGPREDLAVREAYHLLLSAWWISFDRNPQKAILAWALVEEVVSRDIREAARASRR